MCLIVKYIEGRGGWLNGVVAGWRDVEPFGLWGPNF
jgi:hypothetical protein